MENINDIILHKYSTYKAGQLVRLVAKCRILGSMTKFKTLKTIVENLKEGEGVVITAYDETKVRSLANRNKGKSGRSHIIGKKRTDEKARKARSIIIWVD